MAEKRMQFGVERTVCACHDCLLNCRYMPGYLIPVDLGRMIPSNLVSFEDKAEWAEKNLLASPGATVMDSRTGEIRNIPTLVPAFKSKNRDCINLDENNMCKIHADAPFGCAFFDSTDDPLRSMQLSSMGLASISESSDNSLYKQIWRHLHARGLVSISAIEKRANMQRGA